MLLKFQECDNATCVMYILLFAFRKTKAYTINDQLNGLDKVYDDVHNWVSGFLDIHATQSRPIFFWMFLFSESCLTQEDYYSLNF